MIEAIELENILNDRLENKYLQNKIQNLLFGIEQNRLSESKNKKKTKEYLKELSGK